MEKSFKLYQTTSAWIVEKGGEYFRSSIKSLREILNDPAAALTNLSPCAQPTTEELLAPIDAQEVWAAGVTYFRSRDARMEESADAGGGDFYSRVYDAPRPELFFKAVANRVRGSGATIRVRADSKWSVPEPELTLVINRGGKIVGYTIGNDVSSRDIEGENPLYLPQAKMYEGSCAIGPCIYFTDEPLDRETKITIEIARDGVVAFEGSTTLAMIKRDLAELVSFLYRELKFPAGCLLMTGTGIIPPAEFSLRSGDVVSIRIDPIGTLVNRVE
jgi:2-dehydro-3-deoxy-D-arabinonate dehydratase